MGRNENKRGDRPTPIRLVIGGQWGSEAKGMVAAAMCQDFNITWAVRTGAVNAGHTVYCNGVRYKMQQLPTGWVNPETTLVLGPGAYINPGILEAELDLINLQPERLRIDTRAGLHLSTHTDRAAVANRHLSIGATGKGCSEAVVDRIRLRGTGGVVLFRDWVASTRPKARYIMQDTELTLNSAYDRGESILIEATQGQELDILTGPYPYTSHKPTGPAQWLVENGLSPNLEYEIAMVVRTYPIRVAGNSGPMADEISWETLAHEINAKLIGLGMAVKVDIPALDAWRRACNEVAASSKWIGIMPTNIVTNKPDFAFETWTPELREMYKFALSNFHADVFNVMNPDHRKELEHLFEFTTVTGKLRRVARMNMQAVKRAARQIRPNYAVVTFMNYVFPGLWGMTAKELGGWKNWPESLRDWLVKFWNDTGVAPRYFTTGPESKHLINTELT